MPAVRRATYQDVLDAPEHMIAEVLDGTLTLQRWQGIAHGRTSLRLLTLLAPLDLDDESAAGWSMLHKLELHLGSQPDIVVPDVLGWRNAHVTREMEDAPWISVAPDWVCERPRRTVRELRAAPRPFVGPVTPALSCSPPRRLLR